MRPSHVSLLFQDHRLINQCIASRSLVRSSGLCPFLFAISVVRISFCLVSLPLLIYSLSIVYSPLCTAIIYVFPDLWFCYLPDRMQVVILELGETCVAL